MLLSSIILSQILIILLIIFFLVLILVYLKQQFKFKNYKSNCIIEKLTEYKDQNKNKNKDKNKDITKYKTNHKINIHFCSQDQACTIFKTYHLSYFSKMKPLEMTSRNCNFNYIDNDDKIKKLTQFYCQQCLSFTEQEKENLFSVINYLNQLLVNPSLDLNIKTQFHQWNFIKVSYQLEGGLPHTIDKYIVISDLFLDDINQFIQKKDYYHLNKDLGTTLLHEYIHVLQRQQPDIFDILYLQYWNFGYGSKNYIDPYVGDQQRLNPDGLDKNWYFKINSYHHLYPYVKLKSTSLEKITKYGLLVSNQKVIKNRLLKNYQPYQQFFCHIFNNYDPNELSASLISEYLLNQYFHHDPQCPSIISLKKWMKVYF